MRTVNEILSWAQNCAKGDETPAMNNPAEYLPFAPRVRTGLQSRING